MKARTVNHRYLGPRGEQFMSTRAQAFRAVCSCSWVGQVRFSRIATKQDWAEHAHQETLDWLADIEADRAHGLEADL